MIPLILIIVGGLCAVAYGIVTILDVMRRDAGTQRMQEIAAAIAEGAQAYLKRQYLTIGLVGVVLFVLLAVLGVTIVRIGQLTWLHLFLGLALIGPIVLKLASTGYRFMRYYTGDRAYRLKGAPPWPLRLMGPVLVLSTLGIFATGIALLALGPGGRQPWMFLHKVSFFIWLAFASLHVLGHLPEIGRGLVRGPRVRREVMAMAAKEPSPSTGSPRAVLAGRMWVAGYTLAAPRPGRSGRAVSLGLALAAGLILAAMLIPDFAPWVHDYRHFLPDH